MNTAIGQRLLMGYAGVLTLAFAVVVLSGFAMAPRKLALQELDVQRINLVEPDGSLRMVISDKARFPGVVFKGKEYEHPTGRKEAGMLFFNDEGTENGGLVFGGYKDQAGVAHSSGHLSFDQYEQDQMFSITAKQEGGDLTSSLALSDYPSYSILEELQLYQRIKGLDQTGQKAAWARFAASHPKFKRRLWLGRGSDKSVQLAMLDADGKPRLVMKVAPDGTPSLQTLDANGKVTGQLPAAR